MLFNSHIFIFIFLPITIIGYYYIGHQGFKKTAMAWLVAASLFFYGWWNPSYLWLILASILFNYSFGFFLGKIHESNQKTKQKIILTLGITGNILLIGYFKYADFFIANTNVLLGTNIHLQEIILPLAISFFTFQQIAYLVDAYKGKTREYNFLNYCLFVSFFPQLIAGPIVHHREMLPQFNNKFDSQKKFHFSSKDFSIGITFFIIGLFKKVFIADQAAQYATPVFQIGSQGHVLTLFEAWGGVLAYTFQLYFDFSGYSDMAIGLGRLFGIRLPLNFHSPYKAVNIIDFWRRVAYDIKPVSQRLPLYTSRR